MNNKLRAQLGMMAMMAMMSNYGPGHGFKSDSEAVEKQSKPSEPKNWDKKCFRPGCEKLRDGNKLYCSAECNRLHKAERKAEK